MPVHTPRVSTSWLCLLVERVSKRPRSQLPIPPQQPHAPTAGRSNCPPLVCYLPLVLCPSLVCYLSTARLLPDAPGLASHSPRAHAHPGQHPLRVPALRAHHRRRHDPCAQAHGSWVGVRVRLRVRVRARVRVRVRVGLGLGLAHNPSPNPNQVGTTCPRWTRTCSPPTSRT